MLYIFAKLTGWRRLARAYALHGALPLERYRSGGAVLGGYGWTAPPLSIYVGDDALVLVPLLPFRPIFPAVAIAWSEILASETTTYRFFTVYRLTLAHGGAGGRAMTVGILPTAAIDAIREHVSVRTAGVAS